MSPILASPRIQRHRTSDVLISLAEEYRSGSVTLRTPISRLGDRTFGIVLIMFAGFNVIPFISMFSGALVALIGLQLVIGRRYPYIPARILDWPLPGEKVSSALLAAAKVVQRLEKLIRPRWLFMEAPIVDRLNGLVIAALGILIALPIPFTNVFPSVVIIAMALGLLERDGMVQGMALIFSLATIVVIWEVIAQQMAV